MYLNMLLFFTRRSYLKLSLDQSYVLSFKCINKSKIKIYSITITNFVQVNIGLDVQDPDSVDLFNLNVSVCTTHKVPLDLLPQVTVRLARSLKLALGTEIAPVFVHTCKL